jgi:hypothetical protein
MHSEQQKVSSKEFYREYHGHLVRYLEVILPALRNSSDRMIWTAGDSSLDNKYYVYDTAPAVGAYKDVLHPETMKQDVTYWLNHHCENGEGPRRRTATINTAVEATTLNERTFRLRPQDVFLRDNIKSNDILVVSVGGNDIAMAPLPCTIAAAAPMLCMPTCCLENGFECGVVPCDDYCYGCGSSLCSCACACPSCLGYFRHMFGTRVEHYIKGTCAESI